MVVPDARETCIIAVLYGPKLLPEQQRVEQFVVFNNMIACHVLSPQSSAGKARLSELLRRIEKFKSRHLLRASADFLEVRQNSFELPRLA
jgi:hypothetical protein